MKTYSGYSMVALLASTALAQAGGIERTTQSVAPLFETGRYLELSFTHLSPSVDGVGVALTTGSPSGDMLESYFQFGAAYKADINNELSYAIIFDTPYGANVAYPAGTGYFAQGSTAELKSYALTGLVKYKFPSNFSVYGGLRAQSLEATTNITFAGYNANAERDYGLGFVIGAAYEIPEIAARVSLTYNSEIKHELATTEIGGFGTIASTTTVETPDSVNLEFQSGVAEDTLVFGSIRWVDWSEFTLDPTAWNTFVTGGRPLVSYGGDYVTYTLGVGRRLNDQWSVAGTIGFENEVNALTTNLGPVDGNWSVGIGATYAVSENVELTGGIRYIDIGNAGTNVGAPVPGGLFEDNSAVAAGFRLAYNF
ncbi:MAG: outer membrane protein transport protein [Pseudomonadota bacterium]